MNASQQSGRHGLKYEEWSKNKGKNKAKQQKLRRTRKKKKSERQWAMRGAAPSLNWIPFASNRVNSRWVANGTTNSPSASGGWNAFRCRLEIDYRPKVIGLDGATRTWLIRLRRHNCNLLWGGNCCRCSFCLLFFRQPRRTRPNPLFDQSWLTGIVIKSKKATMQQPGQGAGSVRRESYVHVARSVIDVIAKCLLQRFPN